MITIHKYSINISDPIVFVTHKGAQFLSFQNQDGCPTIWLMVDTSMPTENKNFFIVGAGHAILEGASRYLATLQQEQFVWHLFEVL